jgi:nicotinate-nucleotide--dimethylbenzimidazole phosphoribosyltransferase
VDAGVNYDFPLNTNLISAKLGWEHSLFARPSHERHGTAIVLKQRQGGCKKQVVCIGFGEMGIGNTLLLQF